MLSSAALGFILCVMVPFALFLLASVPSAGARIKISSHQQIRPLTRAQPLLSALTASYLDLYHFSFSLFQHATDFSCSVAIRLCCIRTSIRVTHTCLVSCSISSLRICMCVSPLLCGKCCHSSLLNDRKVSITHCVRLQSCDTPLGGALTCTCLHSPQGPCESLVMTGLILTEE